LYVELHYAYYKGTGLPDGMWDEKCSISPHFLHYPSTVKYQELVSIVCHPVSERLGTSSLKKSSRNHRWPEHFHNLSHILILRTLCSHNILSVLFQWEAGTGKTTNNAGKW